MLTTWPLATAAGSATLRSGEVLLTAWQINWFHHALLHAPLSWADANIFFPYDNAATFNDLLLTHAVITLPAARAGSPVLALNLALLAGIVLCGIFAHLLIVELSGSRWAAMAGGTLFALAPFRFLHLGHVSIVAAWAIPLFFWALLRHLREPSRARAAAAGAAVALSSLYHAAYVAPVVPLVVLFGLRRGPGGRQAWLPLLAAGTAGLTVLAPFLLPYVETLRSFGAAAAPDDLLRYGADLSSLGQKPYFLDGSAPAADIDPEAHLYPGTALALLAATGAAAAAASLRSAGGWRQYIVGMLLGIGGVSAPGFVVSLDGAAKEIWELAVLALIWIGPIAVTVLAIAGTRRATAIGPGATIRLGVAGAAVSFVLALGPEARFMSETIGTAPYALLARASAAFERTRVPARFGGLMILFLALVAGGVLSALLRHADSRRRLIGLAAVAAPLLACAAELPVPPLPRGHDLVRLPGLRDPAYAWLRERPGTAGVLELPDWPEDSTGHWEYRGWRSMRYMLASKQHGKHLVNGSGRITPFFWTRFQALEIWSDDFFAFLVSYFPVDYVLVHEGGIRCHRANRSGADWTRTGAAGGRSSGLPRSGSSRSIGPPAVARSSIASSFGVTPHRRRTSAFPRVSPRVRRPRTAAGRASR